jgi:glycogen debranching enzyme
MQFDLKSVPFSRFGSYMCFNILPEVWHLPGLILRTMHWSGGYSRELMRVEVVVDGDVVEPTITATPAKLTLAHGSGRVEICFAEPDVLRLRGRGVGLRLTTLNDQPWRTMPLDARRWQFNPPNYRMQYMVTTLAGRLKINARRHERGHADPRAGRRAVKRVPLIMEYQADGTGTYELAIEELLTTPTGAGTADMFDTCVGRVEDEWQSWLSRMPAVPKPYTKAATLAMYVNWSAVVAPFEVHRRPTMLMSKNWMNQCWSWDHCFNAMALAPQDADLAWDQLLTLFDHQDRFGCLPDSIMSSMTTWSAVKPPIHGWALSHMARTRGLLTDARAKAFYPQLAAWTEWWMRYRDADGDGLPEYMNGCDSGWDNATIFDGGCPVASPDLSAYLVLQMDVLAQLAGQVGKARAAADWKRRADALLQRMIDRLWNREQFVSLCLPTGKPFPDGDCLLNFIPIILGKRLPKRYRDRLAAALKPGGRFVTRYGPATENPASPLYNREGYWRGPIWAPETLMIVDGLRRGGYAQQADAISERFCDLCARSGFAENFDARSGEALCDKAYTWTSSTFLCLM